MTVWAVSFALDLVIGGDRLGWSATGVLAAVLILSCYEWPHFLIHTPYRPRSRYYRAIWRGHRLRHFKNEHYWFGVTSTVADRLLLDDEALLAVLAFHYSRRAAAKSGSM